MAVLERRSAVALIAPRSRPRFPGPLRGVTAHWNGPAMRLAGKPHSACRAAWRNIQRFHMGKYYTPNPLSSGRHWADVAYTAAVCHHEIVMEGRGPGVRTAANGTSVGNDRWYAIFFMVGGTEEPNSKMLRAAEWYARVHLKTTNWNRHSDHKSTTCAGTVNKYISGGDISVTDVKRNYITVGDEGQAVEDWQRDLIKWDSNALPDFGADGDFGSETSSWTLRFMDAVGLDPADRERPRVGDSTRRAMKEALTIEEPGPFPDVSATHPHVAGIEKMKELGIFAGYGDGTFRPNQPLTRAAAATVLARIYEALDTQ